MNIVNTGLALEPVTAAPPPAAPLALAAAVASSFGSHQISVLPRGIADQGTVVPCCVSCALAGAMESLHADWPALAPLFHYYATRFENAGADFDGSLLLDSGMATLLVQGICRRELHDLPFTPESAAKRPSAAAFADGGARVLARMGRRVPWLEPGGLSKAAWIREQLDQDRPVILGFSLPRGYPDGFLDADRQWLDANATGVAANGHCALAIGYSDARRAFRIQDSLGAGRFDRGCWWMGYTIANSSVLQSAFSLIR